MSSPPFAHGAAPRRPAAPPRAAKPARIPWGWLEWFIVAQIFLPALLFVPGISAARVVIRVAVFMLSIFAWFKIGTSGRCRSGTDSFTANAWMKAVVAWLLVSVLHPDTNSPLSGAVHAMLYIAVFCPLFWAAKVLVSPRQVGRLMLIMLACNGLSAMVGLGQVFRPGTFNPPVIPGVVNADGSAALNANDLSYEDASGQRIIRPCGLSDQVGSAAGAGATAALIGLAFALRPIGPMKRMACLALAFFGVAVIYYSQVRMILMMLVICIAVLVAIFAAQKNYGHASLLGGLGAAMVVGALSWVMATSGEVVVKRFLGLVTDAPSKTYVASGRSDFVVGALTRDIWNYPLGVGLGRYGTVYSAFGDKSRKPIWAEVMVPAWVFDGGMPLLFLYGAGLALAMGNTLRVALRSRDRELGFWAAVVFSSNLSVIATCFSYVSFETPIGMQFWLLATIIHAADVRTREATATRPRPRPAPPRSFPAAPPPAGAVTRLSDLIVPPPAPYFGRSARSHASPFARPRRRPGGVRRDRTPAYRTIDGRHAR